MDVVDSMKYLEVTINKDLRWNNHINSITSKVYKTLGLLGETLGDAGHQQDLQHTRV